MKNIAFGMGLGLLVCCSATQEYTFSVRVVNCRLDNLQGVVLKFGDIVDHCGDLVSGISKSRWMENESIPQRAVLIWVDSSGDRFQREVQVQGLLPDDFFNDQVVFRLLPDDVVQVAFYPGAGVGLGTGWRLSASTTDYCGRPRPVPSSVSTGESGPKKDE